MAVLAQLTFSTKWMIPFGFRFQNQSLSQIRKYSFLESDLKATFPRSNLFASNLFERPRLMRHRSQEFRYAGSDFFASDSGDFRNCVQNSAFRTVSLRFLSCSDMQIFACQGVMS
ncbi:hypothetical protein P8452_51909 [Trifolium repens]|nr:hypothetical protein P8452_51909 [Trifolium repens]